MSIHIRILISAVTIILLFPPLVSATPASGPHPVFSMVSMPFIVNEDPVLFIIPNGAGNLFTQARAFGTCEIVNATIEVTLRSIWDFPVPDYPLQDLWLGGGLQSCDFGSWPDSDTNSDGVTSWSLPVRAGGSGFVEVLISGTPIMGPGTPLNLRVNSPDINGDGTVNIADISLMARGLGATCSQ